MGLASFFLSPLYRYRQLHNRRSSFEGRLPIGNPCQSAESVRELSVAARCNNAPIPAESQSPNVGFDGSLLRVSSFLMLYKRFTCPFLLAH